MLFGLKSQAARFTRGALAAALLASMAATAPDALASGIFASMSGDWSGDGTITWYSGETEQMRCKATNSVAEDGYKLAQTLTCANPSIGEPWKIKSDLAYREAAGIVVGSWSESKYGMNGDLSGRASPSKIDAQVRTRSNSNISVQVVVLTNGDQQSVVMKVTSPEGLTEIAVTMKKA
jgi:hypothetical protein